MSYLVYIVSASGPYAEKSADGKFYLDKEEAQDEADRISLRHNLTLGLGLIKFSVYPMTLSSLEDTQ